MAIVTIQNSELTVQLDSCGAVLHSIQYAGAEYLWQGNPTYWKRRDAQLFPYVGRLTDGVYTYQGKQYPLPTHGFCIGTEFEVGETTDASVEFVLRHSDQTLAQYPFRFVFRVKYTLEDNQIVKTCTVENKDDKKIHFGIGSHPGFNVPINGEGAFTDWYLEFPEASQPMRQDMDPANYRLAGTQQPFSLKDGKIIPLTHSLFDLDAVVLTRMPRQVSIKSSKSSRSVTVEYPHMPFLGLWHAPKTDAPYVCIEPWVSLPSHSTYIEDLETQEHLIALESGKTYENVITITLT